jgi:hypothetical protein
MLIREALALAEAEPYLFELIEKDLDALAVAKKQRRLEEKSWYESQGKMLPGFEGSDDADWLNDLSLGMGRPRMPAVIVLVFLTVRGYVGGFKNRKVATLLLESKTLEIVLKNFGYELPGFSTIIDNVNAVSQKTIEAFLDAQIRQVAREQLDDFKEITFDSTAVRANSEWPTDSALIMKLALRAMDLIRNLGRHGVTMRIPKAIDEILSDIKITNKEIQLSTGKRNGNKTRAKLYRKLYRLARKLLKELRDIQERANGKASKLLVPPSTRRNIELFLNWLDVDIKNLDLMIINSGRRINKDEKVPAEEKYYSVADEDAAMIVKGGREPTFGFRPQLGRSANGFVTALIVPVGNAADSAQMEPIVDQSIIRTGITPSILSFDDGYTSGAARAKYTEDGIKVSFSGAKGKQIIPSDEYDSAEYRQARNNRSAVESLMFVLRHNHRFDQVMRRGIDAVRCELLEKVLVYNFFRIIHQRTKREQEQQAA